VRGHRSLSGGSSAALFLRQRSELTALIRRRPELLALFALLVVGILLRLYFTLQWRPAITGYSDSGIYFQDGVAGPFADPIRTVGYGIFLIALHWITPHLLLVVIVQHVMGLLTGMIFFLTLRRCGAPAGLGLAPAAVVLLGGTQLFLEHAALSEAFFTLLLAAMLYAAVRAWRDVAAWAAVAGLCAGLAVTVREAGMILVPLLAVWLLLCAWRPSRHTIVRAVLALTLSLAVIGGYVAWRDADTGLSGLTTNGNYNLYGRVAPFADCAKFDPPAGTAALCDPLVPSLRHGRNDAYYIFSPDSPAQRMFGPPYRAPADRRAGAKLRAFSIAAIEGQPLDYLNAVWQDAIRLLAPDHRSYGDLSARQLIAFMLGGPDFKSGRNDFVNYWRHRYYPHDRDHHGNMGPLKTYEQLTRIQGPLMLMLLLLATAAPWAVRGDARRGAWLFASVAYALLLLPILTKGYDFRFVIPPLGPLAAAAALGGWGLTQRIRPRLKPITDAISARYRRPR
jgi:hypothetical protein